ncbi:HlyD family secretion protein [Luteolibacter arcticus]|uniref:HlyD family secretion protein n=1 Tax=Luteolibacter arcticus TaxID=1581411 RepID=A0ABT3GGP8_9BACT|nr:HlyD family secretion protein [Luteolibacter arcticus]MCW1922194.1 HlyD family secretion protein [Luteolibacter arcticus]
MSDGPTTTDEGQAANAPATPPAAPAVKSKRSGCGTKIGALILLLLIVGSLVLYFIADRLTPSTSQARIQAFVVPVAAEVAGKVSEVKVGNNDEVEAGTVLFVIDKGPYEIGLQKSKSDYETIRRTVNGSVAAVESAEAALEAAQAGSKLADVDATRQERLYAEDPGAISVRRLEIAQATRVEAVSQVRKAEADLRKAKESAGDAGERNAQLLSAKAAIEKAELDLANTTVVAPVRGRVTDLQVEVGHFAQPGAPLVTLIAGNNLWISADMTENNLGHLDVGDKVAIALDVLPGRVLKGRVRSIGNGVSSGQEAKPGALPPIENNRDWLRQAQRFPVAVEFDPAEHDALRHARIGGQAEVLVFTGDNPAMNELSSAWIWLKSQLSYLY